MHVLLRYIASQISFGYHDQLRILGSLTLSKKTLSVEENLLCVAVNVLAALQHHE